MQAHDLEQTLCDLVRGRVHADMQVVNPAMKRYIGSGAKDIKLLACARALGVEKKIRNYLEVLLRKRRTPCSSRP